MPIFDLAPSLPNAAFIKYRTRNVFLAVGVFLRFCKIVSRKSVNRICHSNPDPKGTWISPTRSSFWNEVNVRKDNCRLSFRVPEQKTRFSTIRADYTQHWNVWVSVLKFGITAAKSTRFKHCIFVPMLAPIGKKCMDS